MATHSSILDWSVLYIVVYICQSPDDMLEYPRKITVEKGILIT